MPLYPNGIDSYFSIPQLPGSSDTEITINNVLDATIAVEKELGIRPKGVYSDVATRLAILESRVGPGPLSGGGSIDINTQTAGILTNTKGGTGLDTIGSADTVLTSTGLGLFYKLLTNINISATAAIAGTKISPNFGSQLIQSTGDIQINSVILTASGPTITKGTGVPATSPPDGSIFLRTDGGTSTTAVYARQSGVWSAIGGGAPSGSAGGDLDGTYPNPTVKSLTGTSGVVTGPTTAITIGTNPATAGDLRLKSAFTIQSRNAANSANILVLSTDSSNRPILGDTAAGAWLRLGPTGDTDYSAGTGEMRFNAGTGQEFHFNLNGLNKVRIGNEYIRFGTTPATTGFVRLPSTGSIVFRNSGNLADVLALSTTSGDTISIGENTNATWVALRAYSGGAIYSQLGGFDKFVVDTNKATLFNIPLVIGDAVTGANAAATGDLRVRNATNILAYRNAANTADMIAVATSNLNDLYIGASSTGTNLVNSTNLDGASAIRLKLSNANKLIVDASGITIVNSVPLFVGSTDTATAGDIRLRNASSVYVRNAANTANLTVWETGSDNNLYLGNDIIGNTPFPGIRIYSTTAGNIFFGNGSNTKLALNSDGATLWNDHPIIFGNSGLNPAASGKIRMPSAAGNILAWRNAGNTADHTALAKSAAGILYIGREASGTANQATDVLINASISAGFQIGTTDIFYVESTRVNISDGIPLRVGITNVASAGDLRTRNAFQMRTRNVANSNDLALITTDSNNDLYIGTDTSFAAANQFSNIRLYATATSGSVLMGEGGSTRLRLNSSGVTVYQDNDPLIFGNSATATTGTIRLRNGNSIYGRNSANTADYLMLHNTSDLLFVGATTNNGTIVQTASTGLVYLRVGANDHAEMSSTVSTFRIGATEKFRIDANGFTAADPATNGGRLTLTTAVPVTTTNVASATTVYWTPYNSRAIALFDGTRWITIQSAEVSIALGTLVSGKNYDVFGYLSGSALALELSAAWTSDVARADALTRQDGVLVKSAAATRRYLGTFRTTSTTQTQDTTEQRFLYNQYNRVAREMKIVEATDSWTYINPNSVWRAANNLSSNAFEYVVGDTSQLNVVVKGHGHPNSSGSAVIAVGVGIDSTTTNSAQVYGDNAFNNGSGLTGGATSAFYNGQTTTGYHKITWLETGETATITYTFFGDSGKTIQSLGMVGRVMA